MEQVFVGDVDTLYKCGGILLEEVFKDIVEYIEEFKAMGKDFKFELEFDGNTRVFQHENEMVNAFSTKRSIDKDEVILCIQRYLHKAYTRGCKPCVQNTTKWLSIKIHNGVDKTSYTWFFIPSVSFVWYMWDVVKDATYKPFLNVLVDDRNTSYPCLYFTHNGEF